MSNSSKIFRPVRLDFAFVLVLLHHPSPFASMARPANSPLPSSSPQRPTTRARSVAFENDAKLPRTRSRTANTDPQQQPPVKEKSPAKKKTAAISYDTITKVGPPRGHKKNDTSALSSHDTITRVGPPCGHKKTDVSALSRTTDKATILTNRQRTGGSVSDTVGYVLFVCFHYCYNLDGTRLRVVLAIAFLP